MSRREVKYRLTKEDAAALCKGGRCRLDKAHEQTPFEEDQAIKLTLLYGTETKHLLATVKFEEERPVALFWAMR